MRTLVVVVAMASACACTAATSSVALQPADFAEGVAIDAPAGQAFFRLAVPDHVFLETAWPDLRDLAVFNAAGEPVAFARVAPPSSLGPARTVSLRTFRLETATATGAAEIRLDARDLQLRVTPAAGSASGAEYLLAAADEDRDVPIAALRLVWPDHASNWQETVSVDVSRDLSAWRLVAANRPIIDVKNDAGERLKLGEVAVDAAAARGARYWRLRFGVGAPPQLTSVEGVATASVSPRRMVSLPTTVHVEPDGSAVYALSSPAAVVGLVVTPAEENSVLPLAIQGRAADADPWQWIGSVAAYRILANGSEQVSGPVLLDGQLLASVRVRAVGASWGAAPPTIVAERDPVTLVVNARGAGPFLLAWGSRAAMDSSTPFAALVPSGAASDAAGIAEAREGPRRVLGGAGRLTEPSPAERASLWQKAAVWVMLIGGVGALAFLAMRVWKESTAVQ